MIQSITSAWIQLSLNCKANEVDTLEQVLLTLGAASVTLLDAKDQPILEPAPGATPLWHDITLVALFDSASNSMEQWSETLRQALQQALQSPNAPDFTLAPLKERDWTRAWMDNYKPMQFGDRLWIYPEGFSLPLQDGSVVMRLDPGLAFGTGTHPTTAMCLRWLAKNPPLDQVCLDFGCGSGILAIAALLLGARHCRGIDNDPQALQATLANAEKNQVSDAISVSADPNPWANPPVDLLLANILARPLLDLRGTFGQWLRPGGRLVLSGILEEQLQALQQAYQPQFHFENVENEEGWLCISGIKR